MEPPLEPPAESGQVPQHVGDPVADRPSDLSADPAAEPSDTLEPASDAELAPAEQPIDTPPAAPVLRAKRPRDALIAIIVLGVLVLGIAGALAFYLVQLNEANSLISNQEDTIQDQEDLIKEQQELVDKKETFNTAMQELVDTAGTLNGVPMATVVPINEYQSYATDAWLHRWDPIEIDADTENVRVAKNDLDTLIADAATKTSSNATGTTYEKTIDSLGEGFVESYIDNADALCGSDVLACVFNDDPYVVHFDKADLGVAYMTTWLQKGIAYHEFAHVLQFTNPEPTEIALESFDGDHETMADCFALTYLDGWTLDHRIYQPGGWWDVSIGYGYTCNSTQRDVVREWRNSVGFEMTAISQ